MNRLLTNFIVLNQRIRALVYKLLIVACTFSSTAYALPGDSQQPINIQADSARQKTTDGIANMVYRGNVVMTQGSLLIEAETLTLISKDNKVEKLIAEGDLATFQQQSDPESAPVDASAKMIRYIIAEEIATFIGDATIEQEGSIISGAKIDYNINKEQVKANSDINNSKRVQMVLEPEKKPTPKDANGDTQGQ